MDEAQGGIFSDSWLAARVGNAIDVAVDRTLHRPQLNSDQGQAYGVDPVTGKLYQLGQTNSQIVAQVQTGARPSNMMLLLIAGAIALVLMGSK